MGHGMTSKFDLSISAELNVVQVVRTARLSERQATTLHWSVCRHLLAYVDTVSSTEVRLQRSTH
jgi:hypothetical protein